MNIQKMCFRKEGREGEREILWGGVRELTLINIRSSKNESETEANFMEQLIIGLHNYTGEFTNDFFKGHG